MTRQELKQSIDNIKAMLKVETDQYKREQLATAGLALNRLFMKIRRNWY